MVLSDAGLESKSLGYSNQAAEKDQVFMHKILQRRGEEIDHYHDAFFVQLDKLDSE